MVAELGVSFVWDLASVVVNRHKKGCFPAKVAGAFCL
jgi:hypothetical protein